MWIWDEQPGSYFLELRNNFLGVEIIKVFDADPGWRQFESGIQDPGSEMEGSGIRDKHPGSATLVGCRVTTAYGKAQSSEKFREQHNTIPPACL
jgi:hypothetical protein